MARAAATLHCHQNCLSKSKYKSALELQTNCQYNHNRLVFNAHFIHVGINIPAGRNYLFYGGRIVGKFVAVN